MKRKLLLFCLTMFPFFVFAKTGKCGDNVTYIFNEETHVLTISGEGPMYDYGYTSNYSPFNTDRDIWEVIINDGVTSIGDYAFFVCSSIISVKLPDSLKRIGKGAFQVCLNMTSIDIPNGVTIIGSQAFQGCNSLTSIVIPSGVTVIEAWTFLKCNSLTSISIPNNVTIIKERAFEDCSSLATISIPQSITEINRGAFDGCVNLNSVHITNLESWCKIQFTYGNSFSSNPLYYAHHLFLNNNEVKDLVIPNGVDQILDYAFEGCSGLCSVTIPNNVLKIGRYSFRNCMGITSVKMPETITDIGPLAFQGCTSLASIDIPNSVTTIGSYAFSSCTNLNSVIIPNGVTSIGQGAFKGCNIMSFVTIPETITHMDEWVFTSCDNLSNVYCYLLAVPQITIFSNGVKNATLYVPETSIQSYSESMHWNSFMSIEKLPQLKYLIDEEIYKTTTPMVYTPISQEPLPTKEGYTFSGWSDIPETMPSHDVIVTGSFIINKYKITYIVDSSVIGTQDVEYGATIVPPATDSNGNAISWNSHPTTMPAYDITIYGTYTTGIVGIINDEGESQCYSLDGRKFVQPQNGVNMVKMSDGTVKKVVVK